MNPLVRGAIEANAEIDRRAHAKAIGDAIGKLALILNSLPTNEDVRRIVREEIARATAEIGRAKP